MQAGGSSFSTFVSSSFPSWFIDPRFLSRVDRVDLRGLRNTDELLRLSRRPCEPT